MADAVVFINPVPNKAPQISAFKFIDVISPCYDKITVVSSSLDDKQGVNIHNLKYKKQSNKILRLLNFCFFQIKAFFESLAVLHRGDDAFFWIADNMFSSMLACKLKGVTTHFFLYGITSLENTSKKAKTTARSQDFLSKRADFVCAESESVLTDRGIALSDRTKLIHLYVDTVDSDVKKQNRIGMLCRLASGKCVLESIESFSKFHTTHTDYVLDIVGDGILYDECQRKIAQLNADSFINMHGWLEHEQLYQLMPSWKLLLFATKTEGMPNSVLECMGVYVPPLCSAVGGLKDLIVDKENGFFLRSDDAQTIADALSKVIDSDSLSLVSENARLTVDRKFTLKSAQDNFKSQMGF